MGKHLNTQTLGCSSLTRAKRRKKNQNRKLGGPQKNVSRNREVVLSSNQEGRLLGNLDPGLPGTRLQACPPWGLLAPGKCAASKNKASLPGQGQREKQVCFLALLGSVCTVPPGTSEGVRGQPLGWTQRTPAADDKSHIPGSPLWNKHARWMD